MDRFDVSTKLGSRNHFYCVRIACLPEYPENFQEEVIIRLIIEEIIIGKIVLGFPTHKKTC